MEWKIDLCRRSGRGRCGEEPAAQIGVEPAVPLSRVESRWQQDRAFRREGEIKKNASGRSGVRAERWQ